MMLCMIQNSRFLVKKNMYLNYKPDAYYEQGSPHEDLLPKTKLPNKLRVAVVKVR